MEPLSRPPHRRKHSTSIANAYSSFSSKNPYDDVLLTSGGGGPGSVGKKLGVQDYAEIFSGSHRGSSIPVLDLSGLDERSVSDDFRSSQLDYSNIFGGFRDEDVAVPYDQLFAGVKTRKTSSDKPRTPANIGSPPRDSDRLNSSGKNNEFPIEALDQSIDGTKQQFNLSFNKSRQGSSDGSNGKMHVTELHAVPGFTSFVDGTSHLHKTESNRPVPSLKREVSRAWSFSAEVEQNQGRKSEAYISNNQISDSAVKGKVGSISDESCVTDKPPKTENINLKSHDAKVSPPPSFQLNLDEQKGPRRTRSSSFGSKADALENIAGNSSPSFSDEELDVNSVAAASAAALKKAIEQAQESIRIAKEIMERRRECFRDGSKPSPRGRLKVKKDKKEKRIAPEPNISEENNTTEKYECLELPALEVDRKYAPSTGQKEPIFNAEKIEEKLPENVETAEEHAGARNSPVMETNAESKTVTLGSLQVNSSNYSGQKEPIFNAEKIEEKLPENVETAEEHAGARNSPVLETNAESKTVTLGSLHVNSSNYSVQSMNVSEIKEIETDEKILHSTEFVFVHMKRPTNVDELGDPGRVLDASQSVPELEEVVDEAGEHLRISKDDARTEEKRNVFYENGKCTEKFEGHQEIVSGGQPKLQKLVFDHQLNETQNLLEKEKEQEALRQEPMEKEVEVFSMCKENYHQPGNIYEEEIASRKEDPNLWFTNEEMPKVALEKEINEREQKVFQEAEAVEKGLGGDSELEFDEKKPNCAHDEDKLEIRGEYERKVIGERHAETSEYEATLMSQMNENIYAEDQKIAASLEAEEMGSTLSGAGKSEDNLGTCDFQEVVLEKDFDTSVDAYGSGSSTMVTEDQEACTVELNDTSLDENQQAAESDKENGGTMRVTETSSTIEKNEKKEPVEETFHQEDNEMPKTAFLFRSASEVNFVASKLHNAFEVLSSDGNTENSSDTDASHEENLSKDEDAFGTSDQICNAAQEENANENDPQDFTEFHASGEKTTDLDLTNVKIAVEQTSESDEGSDSISSFENIAELSVHENQAFAENVKDEASRKVEDTDDLEMSCDEAKYVEEQNEVLSSVPSEAKQNEESMKIESGKETGQNLENNTQNRFSTMEDEDAKEHVHTAEKKDRLQRIEAIKRKREREKERIAVERAIREARERAFAEARERAERAAVERAAAEARQRAMAETREKLGKASTSTKQSVDKTTIESKLRTERAAVERATAEARERALEKAFSLKTPNEARTQAEKFSGASRSDALKHSYSSSDLEKFDGNNNESAQRRKARLERHQRIMERAAKALEEKNMRDLLAQKEQAERNRLAESLDADIKRWASGKEGNLRALLSTLQYILGPDSGWQPISLTEIITTPAVKKAYRKATLYVHPDKLQQKGASIQQKYICEKVFDLLKAAWNRFNSEER